MVLPADGKALTQVGLKAMRAGIPVVNLDRVFNTPQAYRCWIGGDNYGMGLNAGHYIGEQLKDKTGARVVELAGLDNLELTKQRTQGFDDALKNYPNIRRWPARPPSSPSSPARPRWPSSCRRSRTSTPCGTTTTTRASARCAPSSRPGRDDFLMVGGAGALSALQAIKRDNSVLKATVLYPPTMAASAIDLARALGQSKGIGGLAEFEIPASLTLYSAVVDKDNVDRTCPPASSDRAPCPARTAPPVQDEERTHRMAQPQSHDGEGTAADGTRPGRERQAAVGRGHGRIRLHGRRPLTGLAHRGPCLRPAPPTGPAAVWRP